EQRDRGRCEAALELYGQALGIDGRNAAALAGRGACYLELSRYAQAEASFEAALESDPRNAEALFGLGETYRYMGRNPEAVALYERFLVVRPTGDEAAAARRLVVQLKE
ncbi:MAG TPA: tetratricopeptide repeat protein, partial [Anaeromyxobacteraceae bacterium]|nr:tetratricopeptide repeat protein [Anaeromyxobacteraceae bacterium]